MTLSDVVVNQYAAPDAGARGAAARRPGRVVRPRAVATRSRRPGASSGTAQDAEAREVTRLADTLPLSLLTMPCLQGGQLGPDQIELLADASGAR